MKRHNESQNVTAFQTTAPHD